MLRYLSSSFDTSMVTAWNENWPPSDPYNYTLRVGKKCKSPYATLDTSAGVLCMCSVKWKLRPCDFTWEQIHAKKEWIFVLGKKQDSLLSN